MNHPRRTLMYLQIFCMFLILSFPAVTSAKANGPTDQLKVALDEIVEILQKETPELHWLEKKKGIVEILKTRLDSKELSMRVLAKNWKSRSNQEKKEFENLFTQVLEHTYIDRIKSYSDERVVFVKEVVKDKKAVVYSELIKNQQAIPIVYRLKNNDGQWRVYDIIIEGVSLVQNYRKQFSEIIGNEEYAGLVKRMHEKIQDNKDSDMEIAVQEQKEGTGEVEGNVEMKEEI